jgi:hypothetical protein
MRKLELLACIAAVRLVSAHDVPGHHYGGVPAKRETM